MFDYNYTMEEIRDELLSADRKYPKMAEKVEGLMTIFCEATELQREVMKKEEDMPAMRAEAIQTAAMCMKFIRDICDKEEFNAD